MSSDLSDLSRHFEQSRGQFERLSREIEQFETETAPGKKGKPLSQREDIVTSFKHLSEHFNKNIKLAKARLKFTKSQEEAAQLKADLESITSTYKKCMNSLHGIVSDLQSKHPRDKRIQGLKKCILEGTKCLTVAAHAVKIAETRVTVLSGKTKFQTDASKPTEIGNFGHWIEDMERHTQHMPREKWCFPILKRVADKLQFKNEKITDVDIDELRLVADHLKKKESPPYFIPQPILKDVCSWIDATVKEYDRAKKRVTHQFEALNAKLNKFEGSGDELRRHQVSIYVQYLQIYNNPLEFPFDVSQLEESNLHRVMSRIAQLSSAKPLSAEGKELQKLLNDPKFTAQAKLEGLKIIRASYAPGEDPKDILISGAGAGGFMFGLTAALKNRQFIILEARSKEKSRDRENIVALGKEASPTNLKMFKSLDSDGRRIPADRQLLNFFGISDLLIANGKAFPQSSWAPDIFEARICDVQEAMCDRLKSLQEREKEEDFIHYGCAIESIEPPTGEKTKAQVHIKSTKEKEGQTVEPSLLVVSEGFQSKTRSMLGIDVVRESTKTRLAFSFFENPQVKQADASSQTEGESPQITRLQKCKNLLLKVGYILRNLPRTIKNGLGILRSVKSSGDIEQAVVKQCSRALLLLGTPRSDYLYATLTPEEEQLLKDLQAQEKLVIDALKAELEKAKVQLEQSALLSEDTLRVHQEILRVLDLDRTKRIEHLSDPKKNEEFSRHFREFFGKLPRDGPQRKADIKKVNKTLKKLMDNLNALEKQHDSLMKGTAIRGRGFLNMLLGLKFSMKIQPMNYQKSVAVFAQITRAEKNYLRAGKTQCVLVGDAASTTDPASGSGFRTTMLRSALLSSSLSDPEMTQNCVAQGIFQWSSELSAQSMREEGLSARLKYRTGSEKVERYLGIAQACRALATDVSDQFRALYAKAKLHRKDASITFTTQEKELLGRVSKTLKESYVDQAGIDSGHIQSRLSKNVEELPPKQLKALKDLCTALIDSKGVDSDTYISLYAPYLTRDQTQKIVDAYLDIKKRVMLLQNEALNKAFTEILKPELEKYLFDFPAALNLSKTEKILFDRVYRAAIADKPIQLTKKESETVGVICSKLAGFRRGLSFSTEKGNYLPEAWFIPLWLSTCEIQRQAITQ